MVQTGDPTNTGKGGESIWGGKFQDEIKDDLKHKTRGVLSVLKICTPTPSYLVVRLCSQVLLTVCKRKSLLL